MAKTRTPEFEEWCNGASEGEIKKLCWKQRFRILLYIVLWAISIIASIVIGSTAGLKIGIAAFLILGGYFMGCVVFCYNNLGYMKSRGHNMGNNLARGILLIYGLILVPLVVVKIASKNASFGKFVSGLG